MKIETFIIKNKDKIIEALDNHVEEIGSLIEGADDETYISQNKKRNKLLNQLLSKIREV